MWRTCKQDVEDQIGIPKQTQYVSTLTFTAVEHYFYDKQFHLCKKRTEDFVATRLVDVDLNKKVSDMDRATLSSLLSPLLQLRQVWLIFLLFHSNNVIFRGRPNIFQ